MKYRLVVSSLAQQEITDALNYYIGTTYNTAEHFLTALETAYDKLERTPQHYTYFGNSRKIRRLPLKDFPFAILFRINESDVIIVGLFNTHRNPDTITNRLE